VKCNKKQLILTNKPHGAKSFEISSRLLVKITHLVNTVLRRARRFL